jgi:hypothetical protein
MSPRLSDQEAALLSNPLLVGAMEWAVRGFPVFRLAPGDKVPLAGSRGLLDATLDLATIERLWTEMPDANIGVRMDGHLAVDLDTDNPGHRDTLRLWFDNGWPLPPTLTQLTGRHHGRRGFHLIYKAPEGVRFDPHPWPGVDIKVGTSGYVVGAPSRHPSGVNYELVWNPPLAEPPIAEAPAWLVEHARKRDTTSPPATGTKREGLAGLLATFPERAEGQRHDALIEAAGYIAPLLPYRDGFAATMRSYNELLAEPYRGAELEDELGRAVGIWDQEQAKGSIEFERKVRERQLWLRINREAQRREDAEEVGSDPDAEWAPTDLGELLRQPAVLPQRFGLLQALYRGKAHWLQGEPESGKSVLAYAEAAHLTAQGEAVVVFDEEAGEADVVDKLRALGAKQRDLAERLVYFGPEGRDLLRHAGRLRQLVADRNPALVVLDSAGVFLALSGLDENKNPDVTQFIVRVLLPMARDLDAAVVVLDHLTKKDTDDNDSRYARGAGDKLSRVDVAYRVWAQKPFSRSETGVVMLRCAKDRTGVIGRGTTCRVAVVSGNGRLELLPTWVTRDEAREMQTAVDPENRVVRALTEAAGPLTTTQVAEAIERDRTTTSRLLNQMHRDGKVAPEQSGRGSEKQWSLVPQQQQPSFE